MSNQPEGPSVRLLRVGEQVRHVLSDILQRGDVHDDVLSQHVVSVTEVRMSPDLRHATVFIKSLLGKDEEAVLKALRTNTAYLQREVAHRVKMKYAAKLKFLADEGVIDETPKAYKPIEAVMAAQADLVEIVHTLKQVVCVKG